MLDKIKNHYISIYNLEHAHSICYWDQTTMMPNNSYLARANAMAELELIIHEKRVSPEIFNLIEKALFGHDILDEKWIGLQSARQEIILKGIVPSNLMKAIKLASLCCEASWIKNKKNNNWNIYSKDLSQLLNLVREKAERVSQYLSISPYEALLNEHEPGISIKILNELFNEIQSWLPDLISRYSKNNENKNFSKIVSIESQILVNRTLLNDLGFDFTRGRLDVSHHPFCAGNRDDIRITNVFLKNDILAGIYATLHECGHALYESHLPKKFTGMPCDRSCSIGIHESQSLLYEMFLGKSDTFIEYLVSILGSHNVNVTQDVIREHILKLKPFESRINTDELHYLQHIYLRYLVEVEVFDHNLDIKDLPDFWNELSTRLLGFNPQWEHSKGCMEDIHWSAGFFGYFPCYMLGYIYAAQLFSILKIYNFKEINIWLNKNIWSVGQRLTPTKLIESTTGSPVSTNYAKQAFIERYK
ncbi:carboxypeptidase M32 [Providencia burhodogranariea]|uniref:Metal-dependent carboxypeptidase n=1 Tax=Providencia burhodogranariea DSM 19968 TaxID=1141662 RepID=K8WB09_9GAMM|nr:carboxypeptidase M32 [Providencia burhodogranariea]EKT57101.1 hypothetical protein OOA_14585 [Providencia burhodogranariea DSM 19968]